MRLLGLITNRVKRKTLFISLFSLILLVQFYTVFMLGYLGIVPQLYNYEIIRASAIAFVTGLLLLLAPIIIKQVRQAMSDKYYAATLLIFLAVTYELAYLATVPSYYGLSLGASLDTATYLQSFASLTYYRKFLESFVGPFLAIHASPILLLIYPIYEAYPSIFTLMTIQVIILMLPMPLMYRLGLKILNDRRYALATALLYVLYPWVMTAYAPFEVVTLAGAFMAMALITMYLGNRRAYWASLTLAMASVEYVPLFGIGLSIYQALSREFRRWAPPTLAYSIAWLLADYYLVMYFSGWTHNIFSNLYGAALSSLLTSITSKLLNAHVARALAIDPGTHGNVGMASMLSGIIQQAIYQYNMKIQYIIEVFGPLAFINFLEPQTILLMPWLAALLTSFTPYYVPNVYYTILISAVALPSSVWVLRRFSAEIRRRILLALLIINVIAGLLMGPLTPLSGLYYGNAIPNWNAPVANQYDIAMIQLANYIPWNASVAVPATAVPWYSITRYGWGSHGVPFLGPNSETEYVAYSPLVPTGYPFSIGPGYGPYLFDDGAWVLRANYTGPIKVINGFHYENTYIINPVLPGTWQYPIAQIPPTNITIQISTEVKPQRAITLLNTTLLKTQLQLPQGIACGNILGPGLGEIEIPGGTYIAQPITINETVRINTVTVFTSYGTSLATAELAITTGPIISQDDTIYANAFTTPWWCSPHSWATPITAHPNIVLKPGTYYLVLTFPTQGQTICEPIPDAPRALLINATTGQVIRQLPCTLGTIITIGPQTVSENNYSTNVIINILGSKIEISGNQEIITQVKTENITNLSLIITSSKIEPNAELIIKLRIDTQDVEETAIPWYLVPTIGLIPTYILLSITILTLKVRTKN